MVVRELDRFIEAVQEEKKRLQSLVNYQKRRKVPNRIALQYLSLRRGDIDSAISAITKLKEHEMSFFREILDQPSGEAPRPQVLPVGTYLCVVDGPYKTNIVGEDRTETVDFNLKIISVIEGEQSEMDAIDGGILGKTIFARFWMTEKALYRLDDFLEVIGIPKGTPYKQSLAEAPNRQVIVSLGQRPSPDGTRMFNEIKSYAKP
jgi:hypothetical protein